MRKCVAKVGPEIVASANVLRHPDQVFAKGDSDADRYLLGIASALKQRMGLTSANIQWDISDQGLMNASGLYQTGDPAKITISIETLDDPNRAVSTIAHELCHHVFLSGVDVQPADFDERLTDLLPTCFGLGVIQSDACLYDRNWSDGTMTGWSFSAQGYLNAQEIGYAMALFARLRNETHPEWLRWLRDDSLVVTKKALRYFASCQSNNEPLLFDAPSIPDHQSTPEQLAGWLGGDDPTFALAATWRVAAMDRLTPRLSEQLLALTHSKHPELATQSIALLAMADSADDQVRIRVKKLLESRHRSVALAACNAAFGLGMDLERHLSTLDWLLNDCGQDYAGILNLIAAMGEQAQSLDESLCRKLPAAINAVDDEKADALLNCLRAITPDASQAIAAHVPNQTHRSELLERLDPT